MRITAIAAIAVLFTGVALAQSRDQQNSRVFYFTANETVQDMNEIATAIRAMDEMDQVSVDASGRSLGVRGTAAQIALAEWLFEELDNPAAGEQKHEYTLPDGSGDVVRVFYAPHANTLQDFQEIATLTRSIAGVRRLFTYNAPRAMIMRSSSAQAGLAEWLLGQFARGPETRPDTRHSASGEYRVPGAADDIVQVFYVPNTTTRQFQEFVTFVRRTTGLRYAFTYNAPRAFAVRGTAEQLASAEQLMSARDVHQAAR